MHDPLAAVEAGFATRTAVEVRLGAQAVIVDPADRGTPRPLHVLLGGHAADVASVARTHLEREGDPGAVRVIVTLDEGAPPLLYRRVILPVHLRSDDARRVAEVLDHTETTRLLRPAFTIRTVIEFDGAALY
ncbi:hypothetical protein SAMN05443637_102225 [Pseudonocardia thermophila]|jgi:hypothetical protein|uniref:OsmC-like protein n=1 Tax=Pseudonocardia thermophila TaxID=1848 RepID=A0A1M6PER6_PSETH|nr:hypothetical protein [Pseudonocardia thermophila]SHK06426.1 hypothetical protein SAMN05443637_102225 [Pseudonocardia thermophila]